MCWWAGLTWLFLCACMCLSFSIVWRWMHNLPRTMLSPSFSAFSVFKGIYPYLSNFENFEKVFNLLSCYLILICSTVETFDTQLIAAGIVMGFTANTEQLSFIGLFLYRIKHKCKYYALWRDCLQLADAGTILRVAAVQTLLCKALAVVGMFIIIIKVSFRVVDTKSNGSQCVFVQNIDHIPHNNWHKTWRVLIFTIIPGLVVTQVYHWKITGGGGGVAFRNSKKINFLLFV